MKIAEVSTFSRYSVGKIMKNIKDYIDNYTNDECMVFYARGFEDKEHFEKISNNIKVNMNALIARIFDNDGFCFFSATQSLIKKLEIYRPDIVHIHCLHGYYMNVNKLFNYFNYHPEIKVIWTHHDAWAFTGHCAFFSKIDCDKWMKNCCKCQLKKDYPKSIVFDRSFNNFQKKKKIFNSISEEQMFMVVPSNWLGKKMMNSFLNKYSIRTIHNGIDTNIFNLNKSSFEININKKILLGVASVWDNRKGLNKFIEIDKFLDDDWVIILIGKFNEKIEIDSSRIIHIERTEKQEMLKAYYQAATIFFNPTLDDNYPTVNLEAQACGAKVLSFDTGGCSETNCGNLYLIDSKSKIEYILYMIKNITEKELNKIDFDKVSIKRMIYDYYDIFKKAKGE